MNELNDTEHDIDESNLNEHDNDSYHRRVGGVKGTWYGCGQYAGCPVDTIYDTRFNTRRKYNDERKLRGWEQREGEITAM